MTPSRTPAAVVVPTMAEASLGGGFWGRMAVLHRGPALAHQIDMLESTGAIECFAVVAGRRDGFVSRDFTSDSDVHKWLEAVARTPVGERPPDLSARFDEVVDLVIAGQEADGYSNTWIQAHFPRGRFRDMETEHEQYTLGHLIEAGVSDHEANGGERLLTAARRAADLLVREFAGAPASWAVGHEEVEIALVRLYRATGEARYLDLAAQLVDQRGTADGVRFRFVGCVTRTGVRLARQALRARSWVRAHPDWRRPERPEGLQVRITPRLAVRTAAEFVSGRWAQTDRPVRDLHTPSGHAVCFEYLHTAAAMVARERGDATLVATTTAAWEHVVREHMFVNGGVGAWPGLEGFGRPYDLDPDRAYAETCASVAGVLWNRELGLLTGEARFDDLLEWQLLNGMGVGTSIAGTAYHYNNPLRAPAGFTRRPWYPIPCCPSNLSRTWASLATLQFSRVGDELRLHQFFSGEAHFGGVDVAVVSELPWSGEVTVRVAVGGDEGPRRLAFRVPSWAGAVTVTIDGDEAVPDLDAPARPQASASGLDPWQSRWARVDLPGRAAEVGLSFDLPVRFLTQDRRVPAVGGRVALARGPLLFCLEGIDHPALAGTGLHDVELDRATVVDRFDPDLLGGAVELRAESRAGVPLRFVPYFLWGNRGATGMNPFVG